MRHESIDRGRRALLRGGDAKAVRAPVRPPWADARFEDACTRCNACVAACPEGILAPGDGGFPEVRFERGSGECTFCAACLNACPEPAFDPTLSPPWPRVASIGDGCLARAGVHCQSCGDACGETAIRFAPRLGGPPAPWLDTAACTGCGACISTCPAGAIAITRKPETVDA